MVQDLEPTAVQAMVLGLEERVRVIRQIDPDDEETLLRIINDLKDVETDLQSLAFLPSQESRSDESAALLADIQRIRSSCVRLQLCQCVSEADRILSEYVEQSAGLWWEKLTPNLAGSRPAENVDSLIETTALELEARSHLDADADHSEMFAAIRASLRASCLESLRTEPATPEQRADWTRELIDRADMTMTAVEHEPAERAAGQLTVMAEDLSWHLKHIETKRGPQRRRLKRKRRQLYVERQERILQGRLDRIFGARFVRNFERLILVLITLVVGLILFEIFAHVSDETRNWLLVVDGVACVFFLTEFFVKLAFVPNRWWWFYRHFLIDFVPSIPIGLLMFAMPANQAGRAVEFGGMAIKVVRLAKFARYFRAFGLLSRALDRLARQYGHVLNQNVILHPTRQELTRSREAVPQFRAGTRRLRAEIRQCWKQLMRTADPTRRDRIACARLRILEELLDEAVRRSTQLGLRKRPQAREIAAETLIDQLVVVTPETAEVVLGDSLVRQAARTIRVVSWAPLRWLPIISSIVPRITPGMTNAEITAATGRRAGRLLKRFHDIWFWFADLYGTVTPSQFVDRVGGMLVKGSAKPVYRLAIFGSLYLLTLGLIEWASWHALTPVQSFLNRYVGPVVIVLGAVSFLIFLFGFWMKRVAQEATEFYERSAQAQFLALTEIIRSRYLRRDAQVLYDRVLRYEWLPDPKCCDDEREQHLQITLQRIHRSLVEAHLGSADDLVVRGMDTTLLLYRDWLDGAIFTDNDTRSTSQLLGNPAVRQFLSLSGRMNGRDARSLQKLDLMRQKALFGGPYLWFNFISRSVAHSVASLLVDYNQNAIPLDELPLVTDANKDRYNRWLSSETKDSLNTNDTDEKHVEETYVTNAFTALHFLDFDPKRDQEVAIMFGHPVLERLERDRSFLIRRIFGTYPMHNRPKEQRVVNLYSLYGSWLSGGRLILLPVFLFGLFLRGFWAFLKWMGRSVQQIRNPSERHDAGDAAQAQFLTAVRKIERIRGPAVNAGIRLRSRIDPEYLGVPLPGLPSPPLPADVDIDLDFLHPDPDLRRTVEVERERAAADMDRLDSLFDDDLLKRVAIERGLPPDVFQSVEHQRVAAVAYLADLKEVRRSLSAFRILEEVSLKAASEPLRSAPGWFTTVRWRRMFQKYWSQHGQLDHRAKRAAWHAIAQNLWGARDALQTWANMGEDSVAEGEKILGEILLHPSRVLEQLIALRGIQTLALLDVLNYREHIYQLGKYAETGDSAGQLLDWLTSRTNSSSSDREKNAQSSTSDRE